MLGFTPAHAVSQRQIETRFDAAIDPKEMASWLQRLTAGPNHVGSPHNKDNAEWQQSLFKSWGWDAHIETFQVLYPTPIVEHLELLGPKPFTAKLNEPALAEDKTSGLSGQLPPYVAYQGDGDVTAPLVYVNYGMPDDYKALQRLGISVRGAIVIARYGAGFRGVKPKLAQQHGAVGCLIYSDPADDGYAVNDVYPKGPARNADGVQRGSVEDITLYPGDPLTPGVGSTPDADRRYTRETAPTILKIPVLPISYGDAQPLLEALGGPVVSRRARGALAITYHVGPSASPVHLMVKSDWSMKPVYNVIAVMKGTAFPDQWVIRGNHRDGWVFGAADPLSGQVALMAEAKAIGTLAKSGLRPRRTLVYASWDGEEPGLIGSTEWAEAHAIELRAKALVYLNSDNIDRGFLSVGGSPHLTRIVNEVAAEVSDPETGISLLSRMRARIAVRALEGGDREATAKGFGDPERDKALAKIAASGADLPIEALGSGSDYTAFLHHLGIASLDLKFGNEGESGGVYHSSYDSYDHYARFGDPGEVYGAVLAKTAGRLAMRMANADVVPMRFGAAASTFADYLVTLKQLLTAQRERRVQVNALRDTGQFNQAADPLHPTAAPADLPEVETLDFNPLEEAIGKLKAAADGYDFAQDHAAIRLSDQKRATLNMALAKIEQRLLVSQGLPGREWYQNLAYAPGVLTGYGAKTFPGIREAIEAGRYAEAAKYLDLTARAISELAAQVEQQARP